MANLSDHEVALRRREFDAFVWNHAADAFQAKFDACANLTEDELVPLREILSPENLHNAEALSQAIRRQVTRHRGVIRHLLQLAGLTRNKILQDIKGFARQEKIQVSLSNPEALFGSTKGAALGSEYLAKQLLRVFGHLDEVSDDVLETLNQATWPGYIRQERAKRMGHEAEYRIACLLRDCRIPFAPEEKAENPLCRDIQIGGMSYDLVSPTARNALLRVVATVHTANIGQYGESKDDLEIRKALAAIAAEGIDDVTLLAFIDGVGFESNTAGLTGVLRNADEFCQFRTIWKVAAIAAQKSHLACSVAMPRRLMPQFENFCATYGAELLPSDDFEDAPDGWVVAGDAFVRIG